MSTKVTPERNDERITGRPLGESAPSVMREDEPTGPRTVGMIGAALVIFGGMALAFNLAGRAVTLGTGWAVFFLAMGMAGLLYQAAFDRDPQFRRTFMAFGVAGLLLGLLLCLVPYPTVVGQQLRWGAPLLLLSLLFFLAFQRNESEDRLRRLTQVLFGGAGVAMAAIGLVIGFFRHDFFLPVGFVLALIGLLYLAAFVGARGIADDLAFRAAQGIAGIGAAIILLVVGRSLVTAEGSVFFVSTGLPMLVLALLYVGTGLVLSLDWPFFVLLRRELGAFFLSPIAYLALLSFSFFAWLSFLSFLTTVSNRMVVEPILGIYIFSLYPVFVLIFVVPILTMRLLSEESRSGTLEVLFTAPVDEPIVVLAKFCSALLTFLVVWLPFGLVLLAIPLAGGNMFDYRPMFSFFVALVCSGAMFVSMGLFCSSLTQNQIGSGMLAFVGMLLFTFVFFLGRGQGLDPALEGVLKHMSYLDLWDSALEGKIVLRKLLFPVSMTILFLFMTVKVLESRKWR